MSECIEAALRRWQHCPRAWWRDRHARAPGAAGGTQLAVDIVVGGSIREAVRHSFPGAIPIEARDAAAALEQTRRALQRAAALPPEQRPALIGPAFAASFNDGPLRLDLLLPTRSGAWRAVLLRYATVTDETVAEVLALGAEAAREAGLVIAGTDIGLIDTEFTYPGLGCYAGLFRYVDVGELTAPAPALARWRRLQAALLQPEPPAQAGEHCERPEPCVHRAACLGPTAADAQAARRWRLDLLGRETAATLREAGHADLRSVHESELPDARPRRILRAALDDHPQLDADARLVLDALPWPHHLLRFETIGFAVPIWPGTRPYEVLPFMWTCATQRGAASPVEMRQFIADASGDPRRRFAETLLGALGTEGTIVAYNAGFERNRIRDLARQFEDLAAALGALLPRIFDLFQLVRGHYYHPAMDGSWSARSVFGAVAPQLQAERLRPLHADAPARTPLEAFALTLNRDTPRDTAAEMHAALADHGARQVQALQRLIDTLRGEAAGVPEGARDASAVTPATP